MYSSPAKAVTGVFRVWMIGFNYLQVTAILQPPAPDQNVLTSADCGQGWFGLQCDYKCRCQKDSCNKNGTCGGGASCNTGWFGPYCQYADLAFQTSTPLELTDGSDATCIGESGQSDLTITVTRQFFFTWLRLVFSTDLERVIEVFFKQQSDLVNCSRLALQTDEVQVDIHCYVNEPVQTVIIKGNLAYLCSVYINGGRQVALKQKASQSPPYHEVSNKTANQNMTFPAANAVDGNIDPQFYEGQSCSKTQATAVHGVIWKLKLSRPHNVDKYVLYFPESATIYKYGLHFEVLDVNRVKLFNIYVNGSELSPVYTLLKRAASVTYLSLKSSSPTLELCEVEVYGDSACSVGKFGADCDQTCFCQDGTACFSSTGECHPGCDLGFEGDTCLLCRPGTFGPACSRNCSQFCSMEDKIHSVCDHVNGSCLGDCVLGYQPPMCTSLCNPGTYGPGCKTACSRQCARSTENPHVYCDSVTGSCVHGCSDGYTGTDCNYTCEMGTYGHKCSLNCSTNCATGFDQTTIACDFVNGSCSHGCVKGHMGSFCNLTCLQETYGANCARQCSNKCHKEEEVNTSSCHEKSGICLYGCVLGYVGESCTESCKTGMYGLDCKHQCPASCAKPADDDGTSCNTFNGLCLYGCTEGYIGGACDRGVTSHAVHETKVTDSLNPLFLLTLLSPMVLLCLLKLFCKKIAEKVVDLHEEVGVSTSTSSDNSTVEISTV